MILIRYGLSGAFNTFVGFSIIAALDLGLHFSPALANAVGYGVGTSAGYALNRRFVFRSQGTEKATAPGYLAAVALGFLLNQLALRIVFWRLGPGGVQHTAAQLIGALVYTVAVFLACRFWVFRGRSR